MSLEENRQFWEQAWADGRTRFHGDRPNPNLVSFGPQVFAAGERILVPLCGKSHDLLWLSSRGHGVVGVELARLPLDEFIEEHQLQGTWHEQTFQVKGQRLTLHHQDFFHHDGRYEGIYDRACFVALTKDLRQRMAQRYKTLLAPGGKILLLTLQHRDPGGPPFSVTAEEIEQYFGADFFIELLSQQHDGDRLIEVRQLKKRPATSAGPIS